MRYEIPFPVLDKELYKGRGMFALPFAIDHFDRIDYDQPELIAVSRGIGIREMVASQAELGTAVTIFKGNKALAIIGVVMLWGGVGEMWAIFDNDARQYKKTMLKSAITFCDISFRYLHLHRLQITVRTDDNRAFNYADHLDFKVESVMKQYGPDKVDYLLMTRF